jgi:hypothetical protein
MGVTSWELGVLRVPLIMVPDKGSFVLTYMVGIIPPNLRSQETDKGVPHTRARRRRHRPGRARAERGVAGRRAGVVWLC